LAGPLNIFITGLGGVFLGMALLYASMKFTAFVISGLKDKKKEK